MRLPSTLLLLLSIFLVAPQVYAQIALVPYLGISTSSGFSVDDDATFDDTAGGLLVGIGGEFALPLELPFQLSVRPSAELVLLPGDSTEGDGFSGELSQTYFQVNVDAIARFPASPTLTPYAGVGLAYGALSLDETFTVFGETVSEESSGSGVGLNILGGVILNEVLSFGSPFVQVRYTALSVDFEVEELEGTGLSVEKDSGGLFLHVGLIIDLGQN